MKHAENILLLHFYYNKTMINFHKGRFLSRVCVFHFETGIVGRAY